MSLINAQGASQIVLKLLRGAQLDSIRVHSLIVQLGFLFVGRIDSLPSEVWVTVSGTLVVEGSPPIDVEATSSRDFFARRAAMLGEVYQLIGSEVTAAGVSDSGVLTIHLGGKLLRAHSDADTDLEEVWSVTSDSPEPTGNCCWRVSLDDSGAISASVPT